MKAIAESGFDLHLARSFFDVETLGHMAADAHQGTERRFFSASESRTVEAIVAQIIPTDETPGAREMGVARFIDHGLAGFLAPLAAAFRAGVTDG